MKKFIQINKSYFFILSGFSLFFLFFGIKKNNIGDIDLILLSLFLIILILTLCYTSIVSYQIHFYPVNVFFNLYILVCYLYFLYNFNFSFLDIYPRYFDIIDQTTFNSLSIEAVKVLITTVLFFNLGFFLIFKLFREKIFNFLPELNEIQFLKLNIFLLIIKLFFLIIFLSANKQIPELTNPINLLIVSISFYSICFFKSNRFLNLFIILFIFFENAILGFAIYKNIILLTVCFIINYNLKKEISKVILGLLLLWVFIGQPLKFDFRTLYSQGINEVPKENNQTQIFNDYNGKPVILRMAEPVLSLIRILEFEKIKKKEIKKDTLSILKYSLIPRIFYTHKPKQDFSTWYTDYFFNVWNRDELTRETVTFNIFWTSDFYINYQYSGSTVLAFIVGAFLSLLSLIFSNFKSNNIHYLFGLSIISALTFPDYNLSLALSPIFLQTLILIFVLKFLIFIIKR